MERAILVVDKSADGARRLATALGALGRPVTAVTSPSDGIAAAERTSFGLAVLALAADCPSRGELIGFLSRSTAAYTPILLVTDAGDHAAHLAEFSGVVDEVLVEPFSRAVLVARSRALLRMQARVAIVERDKHELSRSLEQTREHAELTLQSLRDCAAVLEYNLRFALRIGDADPSEACAALTDAAEAAQRITRRLDTANVTAPGADPIEPTLRRFPLRPLVAAIVRWARREAEGRHVRLGWSVAAGLHVEADSELLERVLQTLVDNALRHTVSGGRIEVRAEAAPSGVRVTVADTGILVPIAQRCALFRRNARGVVRAREGLGPGQALYLCWRIVEAHRGSIGIEDQQGWSNTFVVELPRRVRGVLCGPAGARLPSARERARSR
jgi:signal transduction histidine kinase